MADEDQTPPPADANTKTVDHKADEIK